MSSQTASAAARRRSSQTAAVRRRAVARRRRRKVLVAVIVVLAVAGLVGALPLAQRAYNDLGLPLSYASIIRQEAAAKRLDPAFVAAVIYAETKFDPRTSPAGAEGLMQLEPQTAEFLAHRSGGSSFRVADLGTPRVNIAYGCYYLRYLLDEYHGSRVLALAAYNGGETNVNRWIVQDRAEGRRFDVEDIPFAETRDYVQRVLHARAEYRHTYAAQLGY